MSDYGDLTEIDLHDPTIVEDTGQDVISSDIDDSDVGVAPAIDDVDVADPIADAPAPAIGDVDVAEDEFEDYEDLGEEFSFVFTGELGQDEEAEFNLENLKDVDVYEVQTVLKRDIEIIEDIESQMQDYIDELTRRLPTHLQNKRKQLNIIHKEADNFIDLKKQTIQEEINVKRKGVDYKPLVDIISNIQFPNAKLIPIVNDTVKIYDEDNLYVPDDATYYKKNMDEELSDINKIIEKYLKMQPTEYSYKNKLKELNIEMNPEKYRDEERIRKGRC